MPAGFSVIDAGSLVDECSLQIRDHILSGAVRGGETLKDSVLAAAMGISRSPVREALRRLEQSGLVVKVANRSYRVVSLTETDIEELWKLRWADESLAVTEIVRKRADTAPLRVSVERMRSVPNDDPMSSADTDATFHSAVVALAGLRRLTARFSDLSDLIRLVHVARNLPAAYRQENFYPAHSGLVDALDQAIATQDAGPVLELWREHLAPPVSSSSANIGG